MPGGYCSFFFALIKCMFENSWFYLISGIFTARLVLNNSFHCTQMLVYSLGMTLYWSVDFHLPQNQVGCPSHKAVPLKYIPFCSCTYLIWMISPCLLSARPVEWPSKQPTPQHVRGPGPPQGDSHLHPGSLRISAQSLHPAPARQSHQTAGGGGFSWICESGYSPAVFSCLWAIFFPHCKKCIGISFPAGGSRVSARQRCSSEWQEPDDQRETSWWACMTLCEPAMSILEKLFEIDKGKADFLMFTVSLKTKKTASGPRGISLKRKCSWLQRGDQSD